MQNAINYEPFDNVYQIHNSYKKTFMEDWVTSHKGKIPKRFITPSEFSLGGVYDHEDARFIMLTSMAYGWKYGGVSVEIDAEIFNLMLSTAPSETIPAAWLEMIPGWTAFINAPEEHTNHCGRKCSGYYIARRIMQGVEVLMINGVGIDTLGIELRLTLVDDGNGMLRIDNLPEDKDEAEGVMILANALLFLCSLIPHQPAHQKITKRITRTKRVLYDIQPRASAPIISLENTLNEYLVEQTTSLSDVLKTYRKPHMRRAHWRTYWTGPRNEEQVKVFRWIPPTFVKGFVTE